jgi:hypothetical protein
MRIIGIVLVSLLLTLPIAALSRAPYTPPGARDAVLRLSWRMNVSAREECRPRSAEELEALPVHMRTPEVCTRDQASYVLITRFGDTSADTAPLLRGGVKGDRPLFVLRERRLPPGEHRIALEVRRAAGGRDSVVAALAATVHAAAGAVVLVTLDESGRLVVR